MHQGTHVDKVLVGAGAQREQPVAVREEPARIGAELAARYSSSERAWRFSIVGMSANGEWG
jgi:hypothetical protein